METEENTQRPLITWNEKDLTPTRKSELTQQLTEAANRLCLQENTASVTKTLREDQESTFTMFAHYLMDIASRPELETRMPFARIIQPGRTGKTVVAGHIISKTNLHALYITARKADVEQSATELARMLPGIEVTKYYSKERRLTEKGVIVTTYESMANGWKDGHLPQEVRKAGLVICDEGHRAMTAMRMRMLCEAYDPLAIRLALTASPDYNEKKALARFFPDLIREMSHAEAVNLGLLAEFFVMTLETDARGELISTVAGDFDPTGTGKALSEAPALFAAYKVRNLEQFRKTPTLVTCATIAQAEIVAKYFNTMDAAEKTAVVTSAQSNNEQINAKAKFEDGSLETLVTVGVLAEGWSSEKCKLLIDLSLTTSVVRATQKYYRPLTKSGDAQATIIIVLPRNLRKMPVMPEDIFGESVRDASPMDLEESQKGNISEGRTRERRDKQVAEKALAEALAMSDTGLRIKVLAKITRSEEVLKRPGAARAIMKAFFKTHGAHMSFRTFLWKRMRSEHFAGSGAQLLKALYPSCRTAEDFEGIVAKLLPSLAASRFLRMKGDKQVSGYKDEWLLHKQLRKSYSRNEDRWVWRVVTGDSWVDADDPEENYYLSSFGSSMNELVLHRENTGGDPRERIVLNRYFKHEETLYRAGLRIGLGRGGAARIISTAFEQITRGNEWMKIRHEKAIRFGNMLYSEKLKAEIQKCTQQLRAVGTMRMLYAREIAQREPRPYELIRAEIGELHQYALEVRMSFKQIRDGMIGWQEVSQRYKDFDQAEQRLIQVIEEMKQRIKLFEGKRK